MWRRGWVPSWARESKKWLLCRPACKPVTRIMWLKRKHLMQRSVALNSCSISFLLFGFPVVVVSPSFQLGLEFSWSWRVAAELLKSFCFCCFFKIILQILSLQDQLEKGPSAQLARLQQENSILRDALNQATSQAESKWVFVHGLHYYLSPFFSNYIINFFRNLNVHRHTLCFWGCWFFFFFFISLSRHLRLVSSDKMQSWPS